MKRGRIYITNFSGLFSTYDFLKLICKTLINLKRIQLNNIQLKVKFRGWLTFS